MSGKRMESQVRNSSLTAESRQTDHKVIFTNITHVKGTYVVERIGAAKKFAATNKDQFFLFVIAIAL